MPLFHVGGAFCFSLPTLGAGATIVVPTAGGIRNPEVVANFWRIVEAQRVTITALVPTALGGVAGVPLDGADISRLRGVITGGLCLPAGNRAPVSGVWPGDASGNSTA